MPHIHTKEQAHRLIDYMAPAQVDAVVGLLETMLHPLTLTLLNAPYDDESISEEEESAVAASKEWRKHNEPISNEEVLAEFGLTGDDFDRMGRTPIDAPAIHAER